MKKGLTELVFIVDRSGSMGGLETDTIGGINATLAKNREAEGEANVSIILFDNTSEVLVDRKPIAEVANLTEKDYQVRGCTALLDCLGDAMRQTARVQGYMPDEYKAERVIYVITTDGYENASRHFSYEDVKKAIEMHKEEGWEFLFLGANIDAVKEAGRIGITSDYAATYVPDSEGSAVMYEAMADATCAMRSAPQAKRGKLGSFWKKSVEADHKARG